jgi:hypothetical protein
MRTERSITTIYKKEAFMTENSCGFSDAERFKAFQSMALAVQSDADEAARFNAEVTTPDGLVAYSLSRGVAIDKSEARNVFEAAQRFVAARSGTSPDGTKLDDTMLNEVNGGVSWAAVGGTILGVVGAVAGVAAAVATAPVTIALGSVAGTVALVSTAVVGGAGTAFSGAVTGGLIGGAAQMVHGKVAG